MVNQQGNIDDKEEERATKRPELAILEYNVHDVCDEDDEYDYDYMDTSDVA